MDYLKTCTCHLGGICRRILIALRAVHRPNVQLYPGYPQALDGTNVITQDGQNVPADVIIAATGKNPVQENVEGFLKDNPAQASMPRTSCTL
jgi:hypothetical protein